MTAFAVLAALVLTASSAGLALSMHPYLETTDTARS